MSKSPLSLYQILVEEYNNQGIDPPISDQDIKEMQTQARLRMETKATATEVHKIVDDPMVAEFYDWLHAKEVRRSALCLSGGGIRSGTFALGLIQGLARHNLLSKFDYLSTVSGGGYIGSWLTAWIHRQPDGLVGVSNKLKQREPTSTIDPDPTPIRNLRDYSSFLTPKVGLLSADTWTFTGIYLRNLFLNWLVFIPLLISVLMIPRLVVTMTLAQPEKGVQVSWLVPGTGIILFGRHIFLA